MFVVGKIKIKYKKKATKMSLMSSASLGFQFCHPTLKYPYELHLRSSEKSQIFPASNSRKVEKKMALKAVHISVDQVNKNVAFDLHSSSNLTKVVEDEEMKKLGKMVVIGHRGSGMNMVEYYSCEDKTRKGIKENSILSFNEAAKFPIHFIEFDVQVTKDDYPVIFHDNFILTNEKGVIVEKRVSELKLEEFLSYGPQKEPGKVGKPLYRKNKEGKIFEWKVEKDNPPCTLQEVFQKVEHSLGFNIELKFDDNLVYKEEELTQVLQVILNVVNEYAKDRPIIFSSFQPDATLLIQKLQNKYPVFFLTNGGTKVYKDIRRNSLEEAIKVCLDGRLQGIVSEVKAIFMNPGAIAKIKESKLSLITYGQLNNVAEIVYLQHLMGVEGVIVDQVQEITAAVSDYILPPAKKGATEESLLEEEEKENGS